MTSTASPTGASPRLAALALGAIGVVYGDIGTSPLYTLQTTLSHDGMQPTPASIYGVLSLIFWAQIIVVSLKYVVFIMRADNKGEGGIMALMALAQRSVREQPRLRWVLAILGIFGAALFYGDGVITPAITVLGAVEGMKVAAPGLAHWVVPVSAVVLVILFAMQRYGTARVGNVFGPVMMVWFIVIALLGVHLIVRNPQVLWAINPIYGVRFFFTHGMQAFIALGGVVLALTGAEALYADMGHFGKKPIRLAWFSFVLPALVLNYFGQGALLLAHPEAIDNPFFKMVPQVLLYPMIGLATLAAVIAAQAVISGAFSMTREAISLGYSMRMQVVHT
ncbi:MAG TPA: KUP/HAK/KT family potassium transporter, partial [Rhodanobacter sp.]